MDHGFAFSPSIASWAGLAIVQSVVGSKMRAISNNKYTIKAKIILVACVLFDNG